MKKLIYSMLALFCVAVTFTSCGNDGVSDELPDKGSKNNPYSVAEAIDAVKDLTWTSNTEYDKTGDVYVKGKISRIANHGTYSESGSYGNASFYISDDGDEENEFFCFRVLYLGNQKFVSGQTDIKVGDEVIVCGKLMNYQNNTPETVSGGAYLFSLTRADNGGSYESPKGSSQDNPYSVADAIDAVKDLTWTSNTEYDKTGDVYVKGKISRIANHGTYSESGSYGNASFYISDDGDEENEFFCFRVLYLGNQKFVSGQTDIKVGDEVIVCGKLMNYQNNTPETVSGGAYLFSLLQTGGGSDSGSGKTVSFATNSDTQTWVEETDGVYGAGFCATKQNLKIGYYRHTCSSAVVSPNSSALRLYKNSVLSIATTDERKMKKIVIGCAPDNGTASYCFDMSGLEGGASAVADKSALTVTWSGSASKVVLHANSGQVRMENITVEFE